MKASDITDDVLLAAVRRARGRNGVPNWASTWDVMKELSAFPPKVVAAKLRKAVLRGLLGGCSCGRTTCRGDFEMPQPEKDSR